uniref:Spectrin repeat containing nuclear envelope family member 3 n=1 Tax=Papio anubis TaxID=9555 RepID=A0A8I5N4H8_PAPAN
MTQQPQEDFDRSVEDAQAWMKAVQDQLQVNDNTQGPRAALEARLWETEKICQLEPEGRVKVDLVLRMAEALLACCPGDRKPEILTQLKDIKAQWEETVTYMTHCHSRIEWVWLHWSEYLLARDEFYRWFQKMMITLEPHIELQLGLKEKQWQLSHAQVLLHNVDNQAVLLDRLLEEAASLFNRIGDPSVDEDAQKRMKAKYDAVKAKAQDRVDLLDQVAREHEEYQAGVDEFQLWLKAVVEKVNGCLGRKCKLPITQRLSTLQDIAKDFPRGEQSLERLEEQSVGVIRNTSPLGAEKITGELEEMRKVLEKLRALWEEEEERLRGLLQSRGAFEQQIKQLEAELSEFGMVLQRLAQEGLQPAAKAGTEDELVAHWRRYSATRAALASEEPRVDRLQAQLKELIVFPHDLKPLSDSVIAAIQEYQSLKGKSARLRNAAGVELWQHFQRPLQDLQLWRALAQRLLEVTASLQDLPSLHTFLPQIEAALMESSRLKEPLTMLQLKKDLLIGVFGQERATALLEQVAGSVRDRDLLHNSLLQRKSKLQDLVDRCRQSVEEHCTFSHQLLELRQWIAVTTQKLEAQRGEAGPGDAESQEAEFERLVAEFPEKEAQLSLVEAQGWLVMEKSSPEGAAVVQAELRELAESWRALRLLEESLLSLIRNGHLQRTEVDSGKKMVFTNNIPKSGFLINPMDPIPRHRRRVNLLQEEEGSHEDFSQLLRNFEQWLQVENSKLVRIIAMRTSTAEDLRTRESKLQELEARVPEGQHLFENLLRLGPSRGTSDELEDLRYQWMLYKSKLKDSGYLLTQSSPGEPTGFQKTRRWRGLGSLFRRVCCVALPLQLLLLLFLLLLFLLPIREEDRSCTLANNFARSFTLMLRYNGPPPT